MAKQKKPKPLSVKKPADAADRRALKRAGINFIAILLLVGSATIGFKFLRSYVDRKLVFPSAPPRVVLKNRPAWMSDLLADQISRLARPIGAHSSFDHQLLVDVTNILRSSPWIKEVKQVRRAFGQQPGDTLEIDCDYRAPVALVKWKEYYWLVDGEGVKLPEQYTADQVPRVVIGANGHREIRVIDGVRNPPVESGHPWPGDDLRAGLELARYIYGQPFAEEIVSIDVSNIACRISAKEAQIALGTRYQTQIRWGRPINAKDFFVEVPPAKKLEYLNGVRQQYGRVDGGQPWIDIRFDKITYPSTESNLAAGQRE